jgi:hypothetical protein
MATTKKHVSISRTIQQNAKDSFILALVFIAGLYVAGEMENPMEPIAKGHECRMEDCDMTGSIYFRSEYEEGSDGYLFDLTHWAHPEWSYEQCEEYVMKPTDEPNDGYHSYQ